MLLVEHNSLKGRLLSDVGVANDVYQSRWDQHQKNGCAYVNNIGLIYDAICLAQHKHLNQPFWHYRRSEEHPAIVTLCAFWDYYEKKDSKHDARVPYIQLFLGQAHYYSLIPDGMMMPVQLTDPQTHHNVKKASVLFGHYFLVTYLAGREITASQSDKQYLIHHSMYDAPLFKERVVVDGSYHSAWDDHNKLAWQTLQALHEFPKRFPTLWAYIKRQHEANYDDIQ